MIIKGIKRTVMNIVAYTEKLYNSCLPLENKNENLIIINMIIQKFIMFLSLSCYCLQMVEVVSENRELKERLGGMTTTMAELHTAHQRVQELERILKKFENFFGVLYSELPDVFAREITIEKRLSSLNEYIGNRESELVALRTPLTVKAEPGENPVDEELLGAAMRQLSTENSNMKFRMESMERMMSEPSKDRLTSGGSFNGGAMDDETAERLERLERLVALQLAPQLDDDDEDQNPMQRMSPGGATSSSRLALSESDTEILRDELNSDRSLSTKLHHLWLGKCSRLAAADRQSGLVGLLETLALYETSALGLGSG